MLYYGYNVLSNIFQLTLFEIEKKRINRKNYLFPCAIVILFVNLHRIKSRAIQTDRHTTQTCERTLIAAIVVQNTHKTYVEHTPKSSDIV